MQISAFRLRSVEINSLKLLHRSGNLDQARRGNDLSLLVRETDLPQDNLTSKKERVESSNHLHDYISGRYSIKSPPFERKKFRLVCK